MRKEIATRLVELREKAIDASKYMISKGMGEHLAFVSDYVMNLETQLQAAEPEFLDALVKDVMQTNVSLEMELGKSIKIRKDDFEVNGQKVEGFKIEVAEDIDMKPEDVMKVVIEQLQKEMTKLETREDREGASESHPAEDKRSKSTSDAGATNIKSVGKSTIH